MEDAEKRRDSEGCSPGSSGTTGASYEGLEGPSVAMAQRDDYELVLENTRIVQEQANGCRIRYAACAVGRSSRPARGTSRTPRGDAAGSRRRSPCLWQPPTPRTGLWCRAARSRSSAPGYRVVAAAPAPCGPAPNIWRAWKDGQSAIHHQQGAISAGGNISPLYTPRTANSARAASPRSPTARSGGDPEPVPDAVAKARNTSRPR